MCSLWAASGQNALESSHILVLSSSATATAVLKNLVLPGIGHFTILDSAVTSPADAGNNFFLAGPSSIGKPRAQEAVPLLRELNDSVEGEAVVKDVKLLLSTDDGRAFVSGFSLVIAHNLQKDTADELSKLLWSDLNYPPLLVVRSAGFLAEFFIQFHEQCGERLLWCPRSHSYLYAHPVYACLYVSLAWLHPRRCDRCSITSALYLVVPHVLTPHSDLHS